MDSDRTNKPEPGKSENLVSIVEAHSALFSQLSTELSSTFASVRREISDLRNSTSGKLASLSDSITSVLAHVKIDQDNEVSPSLPTLDTPVAPSVNPQPAGCEPRLTTPDQFDGDVTRCRGFISQCELLFRHQPSRYSSGKSQVAFVISLLTGRALRWAVAVLKKDSLLVNDYERFISEFKLVFDHAVAGEDSASQLLTIRQGSRSVAEYTVEFRILAAETDWGDSVLLRLYRLGLSSAIRDMIACDLPTTLSAMIDLALRLDVRYQEKRRERSNRTQLRFPPGQTYSRSRQESYVRGEKSKALVKVPSDSEEEPMQIGRYSISVEERETRRKNHLCFYCGKADHEVRACAARPKDVAH